MGSSRKDQAQGSEHTKDAPGSNPTEQAQGTHQTRQALGSSHPTEQVEGTTKWAKHQGPPHLHTKTLVRKAHRELARDPDYNPHDDEENYTSMIFMFVSICTNQ
jgi:hypothetical protein